MYQVYRYLSYSSEPFILRLENSRWQWSPSRLRCKLYRRRNERRSHKQIVSALTFRLLNQPRSHRHFRLVCLQPLFVFHPRDFYLRSNGLSYSTVFTTWFFRTNFAKQIKAEFLSLALNSRNNFDLFRMKITWPCCCAFEQR